MAPIEASNELRGSATRKATAIEYYKLADMQFWYKDTTYLTCLQ